MTWDEVNSGLPSFSEIVILSKILINPTNPDIMHLVTSEGLFYSTNATTGCDWVQITEVTDDGIYDIEYHPTDASIMYLSGTNVYRSVDGGVTWGNGPLLDSQGLDIAQHFNGQTAKRITVATSIADPQIFYAMAFIEGAIPASNCAFLVKYNGLDWELIHEPTCEPSDPFDFHYDITRLGFEVNPYDANQILFGQAAFFEWDGTFWYDRGYHGSGHADNHDFIFHPDNQIGGDIVVYAANDGGVFKVTKSGNSWNDEPKYNGLAVSTQTHMSSDKINAYDITSGFWDNGTNMYDEDTDSWSRRGGGDGFRSSTKTNGGKTSIISSNNAAIKFQYNTSNTADFPINVTSGSFNVSASIEPGDLIAWGSTPVRQDPNDPAVTYIGGGHLYKCTEQPTGQPLVEGILRRHNLAPWNPMRGIGIAPNHPDYIYVIYAADAPQGAIIGRSTTGGGWWGGWPDPDPGYWQDISPTNIEMNYPTGIAVSAENPDKAWFSFSGYTPDNKVLMTEDGGQTWVDFSNGLPELPVNCIVNDRNFDGSLYAALDVGVYYRNECMDAWEPYFEELPNVQVNWLEINYAANKLRAATYGRGLWEADLVPEEEFHPLLDLYVSDEGAGNGVDDGTEPNLLHPNWVSEDIWVSNPVLNPGGTPGEHENPIYDPVEPARVHVKVRNRGCKDYVAADNPAEVKLYWAKAGVSLDWPDVWTGQLELPPGTPLGNEIIPPTTLLVPDVAAGGEAEMSIDWMVPDPDDYASEFTDHHFCLLARIVAPGFDEMYNESWVCCNNNYQNVRDNNNIAQRNVTIVVPPEVGGGGYEDDVLVGGTINVGHHTAISETYDLTLKPDPGEAGPSILEEAEVRISMDQIVWNKWEEGGKKGSGIEVSKEDRNQLIVKNGAATVENLQFEEKETGQIHVSFNFLTKELSGKEEFNYHLTQQESVTGKPTGGETFTVRPLVRSSFEADADDKEADKDEVVELNAEDIGEDAIYNWYDMNGNLIYTGKDLSVTADITKKYKLEVIAEIDGYKDYKEVEVKVKMGEITGMSPNPATNQTLVNYHTQGGSSAYLAVFNVVTGSSDQYILNLGEGSITLDLSSYQSGNYEVLLITDGEVRSTESLLVQ